VIAPAAAAVGAAWRDSTDLGDLVARILMAPKKLPVGVVTGFVSGLRLVWLLGQISERSLFTNCGWC